MQKIVLIVVFWFFSFLMGYAQVSDTLMEIEIVRNKIMYPGLGYSQMKFDSLVLDDYLHENIANLLSEEAGLYVKSSGPNGLSTLSMRGLSAAHTGLFWNGISISSPTLGLTDLSQIPVGFFSEINVNMGGASMIDGGGGLGGSVNLVNRRFVSGSSIRYSAQYDPVLSSTSRVLSANWQRRRIDVQTKFLVQDAKNDYPYLDRYSTNQQIKKRSNAALNRQGVMTNVFYTISNKSELAVHWMYLANDKEIPAALGVVDNGARQQDASFDGLLTWNYTRNKLFQKTGICVGNNRSNYTNPVSYIDANFIIDKWCVFYRGGYKFTPQTTFGVKANYDRNIVASSGFEQNKIRDDFSILANIHVDNSHKGLMMAVENRWIDGMWRSATPTLSVYWLPTTDKSWRFFANLSRNVRIPTMNDLYWVPGGNLDLKDEYATSGEIGVRSRMTNVEWGVLAYRSIIDEWIQWLPQNNGLWSPVNIKEVVSSGVEATVVLKKEWTRGLGVVVKSNYRFGKTINRSFTISNVNQEGKQLTYSPTQQGMVVFQLGTSDMGFRFQQKVTSMIYLNSENTSYLPYTAPSSIGFYYLAQDKAYSSYRISLNVENFFNEDYQVQPNQPMPRRHITLGFSFTLKKNKNAQNRKA